MSLAVYLYNMTKFAGGPPEEGWAAKIKRYVPNVELSTGAQIAASQLPQEGDAQQYASNVAAQAKQPVVNAVPEQYRGAASALYDRAAGYLTSKVPQGVTPQQAAQSYASQIPKGVTTHGVVDAVSGGYGNQNMRNMAQQAAPSVANKIISKIPVQQGSATSNLINKGVRGIVNYGASKVPNTTVNNYVNKTMAGR